MKSSLAQASAGGPLAASARRGGGVCRRRPALFLLGCACVSRLYAGGSGLNTVVIVNQSSSNSCEAGNYFCERRQVPPDHVLRISWPGGNAAWTSNDFQICLLTPLLDMLTARQLTGQVDQVVLSMDIPFQTTLGSTTNATTSALFYGLKSGSEAGVTNSYAGSEAVFRDSTPASAPGFSFLCTMITAGSVTQAEALVDQGVASDGRFPAPNVVLAKSSDPSRNLRYLEFDNAIFNVRLRGVSSIWRTNSDAAWWPYGGLGCEIGLGQFNVPPGAYVAGAIADSMTSFGGVIFGPNSQTNLLAFIQGGAAGSYGTVAEPGTDPQKFPNPQVYFYAARGFDLAESYYQSINVPYLGLTVGEPLAAPFARAGYGAWPTNLANSVLSNTPLLSVQFSAADGSRPLERVDLFVDGKFYSTLTNVGPCPGNRLTLDLNGYPIGYTVPTNATLNTVAAGLGAAINASAVSNATQVKATVYGDRIELQSMATNPLAVPFFVVDTNSADVAGGTYRVSYLPDSFPPRMANPARDSSGVFRMDLEIPTPLPCVILASTNLVDWLPIWTNTTPGLVAFQDPAAKSCSARFYRLLGPGPGQPPQLSTTGLAGDGSLLLHLESAPGQPCAILVSSNLVDWTPAFTNGPGGALDFADPAVGPAGRFYRAWLVPPAPPALTVATGLNNVATVRVDNAVQPFTVEVSTNGGPWTTLATHFAVGDVETTAASVSGDGPVLSTFLTASQPRFLASSAFGLQGYSVIGGSPPTGAWLQLTITKTNGQSAVLGVTNQFGTNSSADMAAQLCALVNSNSALQGGDGVVAEDFAVNGAGTATFNLRALSPGYAPAAIQVAPKKSSGVYILPSSPRALTQNLSDLQSRNHLYVTAGGSGLAVTFPLDTTMLADGYHELTAVAYEGSHVRTQTRATAPVRVQNTELTATLTLLDLPDTAPVSGTYHIAVDAGTNDISAITLFSTGGALAAATNQATATFTVAGTNLWAGRHPFYALVESASGLKYRTETRWVRLVNGP